MTKSDLCNGAKSSSLFLSVISNLKCSVVTELTYQVSAEMHPSVIFEALEQDPKGS